MHILAFLCYKFRYCKENVMGSFLCAINLATSSTSCADSLFLTLISNAKIDTDTDDDTDT